MHADFQVQPSQYVDMERKVPNIELKKKLGFVTLQKTSEWNYNQLVERRVVKSLCENQALSQDLREFILKKISENQETSLQTKNQTYTQIAVPSNKLLKIVAESYEKKYAIKMHVCVESELSDYLKEFLSQPMDTPQGIIVTTKSNIGHVIPLLCNFSKTEREIVILDALGNRGAKAPDPFNDVIKACRELDVNLRVAAEGRQVDMNSCRTGALTILRNALLHIKHEENTGNFSNLETMTLVKNPLVYGAEVLIPPEWDCTDQISNKQEGACDKMAPRNRFSKKNKEPQTIGLFRARHTNEVVFSYKLLVPWESLCERFVTTSYPEGVKVSHGGGNKLCIEWDESRSINTFLVHKGYQNARKHLYEGKSGYPV